MTRGTETPPTRAPLAHRARAVGGVSLPGGSRQQFILKQAPIEAKGGIATGALHEADRPILRVRFDLGLKSQFPPSPRYV